MTFGTVFLHESVGKVQIYSGTLVWSQYDYFESRGIDFSEITVSNQVFRRSKFLKKTLFLTQKANIRREWSFWGKMTKSGVIFGIFHFKGHSRWSKLSKKGYFSSLKRCTVLEKDHKKWLPKWLLATILYKNHFKFHLMSCPFINLYFYKSTF